MTPILDGYNRMILIGEMHFHYRPATSVERARFKFVGERLSLESAERALYHFVSDHIVWSDLGDAWLPDRLEALHESKPKVVDSLFLAVMGLIPNKDGRKWAGDLEVEWQRNLFEGVVFELQHPRLAKLPCNVCRKYFIDSKTYRPILSNSTMLPMLREGGPMCESNMDPKCPRGHWADPKGLSAPNREAYRHFLECQAIGSFPSDPLVKSNASLIIKAIEKAKIKKAA